MLYTEDSYTAIGRKDIKDTPLENKFVASGWPAASDDYADKKLNLHELLVRQPSATFFMRIGSQQYVREGILQNDLLIVDRSLPISAGRLVIAVIDGVMSVRRVVSHSGQLCLSGTTPQPIGGPNTTDASVWGVIAHIVRTLNHEV
jgi:DNA polymerase V